MALLVEADGGSRGNPGPAGYGAVVRDAATGGVLAERAAYLGVVSNNVAEYRGLIAGLRAARELDPDAEIAVRMDSKLVVEQMSGRWQIKHPAMRELASEAREIFPPGRVTYEWIPRARNKHADRLANEAMDAGAAGREWDAGASSASLASAGEVDGAGLDVAGSDGAGLHVVGPDGSVLVVPEWDAPELDVPELDVPELDAPGDVRTGGGRPADPGAPTTFVLLRHGETELTPQKRFSGSGGSDPGLSAVGRRQAEAAAARLAARGTVRAVVSSPLRRCRETAAPLADRLGLAVRIEDDLREADFGAWEGLTFAEVRDRYPDDLDAWLHSPAAAPTGGGESFDAVTARTVRARDRLLARHAASTAALVTHVTPAKTLIRLALGAPPEALFRLELGAASLSSVAYYADGNTSVRLLNDTSHL